MSPVTRKDMRNQLMHEFVVGKIADAPSYLGSPSVWQSLNRIRNEIHGNSMHECVSAWEQLLISRDVQQIRQLGERHDDVSRLMLTLSPLNVLLSEDDRLRVLSELHRQMAKRRELISA